MGDLVTNGELKAAAEAAINATAMFRKAHPGIFDRPAQLVLVLKREVRGDRTRLFGRAGGPEGEVLCSARDGETTCAFDAQAILDWLKRKGL